MLVLVYTKYSVCCLLRRLRLTDILLVGEEEVKRKCVKPKKGEKKIDRGNKAESAFQWRVKLIKKFFKKY